MTAENQVNATDTVNTALPSQAHETLSTQEVYAWLDAHLIGTQQADFIPVIKAYIDQLEDDLCNFYNIRLQQDENTNNLNVVFGIEAVFAKRPLTCITTFGEFYLQDEDGNTVFGQSAYKYQDKAFTLLKAFAQDYFNDFSSLHRTITRKDGSKQSTRHHTIIEAMSSHIVDHSNSLQSLDKMVIKSDRSQKITLEFEEGDKHFHERINITATNLSTERKILLQYLVDHINSADQEKQLIFLQFENTIEGRVI